MAEKKQFEGAAGGSNPDDAGATVEVVELRADEPGRNLAPVFIAILVSIFVLKWAQAVFIPLVLALILSYALAPVVDRLERRGIRRGISAAVLLLAIVGSAGAAAYSLRQEAASLIETLPAAVQTIQEAVREEFGSPGEAISKVQQAADEIAGTPAGARRGGEPRVQVEEPEVDVRQYLLANLVNVGAMAGVGLIVVFLAFFLLASGDAFRRKWVAMSGPTLSRKKITIQVMDEIRDQIQRYLGVQVLTSFIVGVSTGLALWAIGLENAAVWGVAAGVLNLVPYLGAIVTTGGTALVAFLQFGTAGMAFAVGGISLVINVVEGYWLTPWLSGRASHMNNVIVFSGLLFWGWLWGGWGLVLGLPIMMVVKAYCDRVEGLKPIGEFMGE